MFIDDLTQIPEIIRCTDFSIFSFEPEKILTILRKEFKASFFLLEPDEKTGKISVENVRDFTSRTNSFNSSDRVFAVLNAETLNPAAENAFLKNLEEPNSNDHFVFLTSYPSALLPTVLSRAQIFFKKEEGALSKPVAVDEKTKTLAKRLITADTKELIALSNEISKKKDNPRAFASEIVATAIEILYKSYFSTNQEKFLKKLPKLLKLYENLQKNGHIKLHLVADML